MAAVDKLLCALYVYFIWSCVFVERNYCARPLAADDERPFMSATHNYATQWNPLFASRPDWLVVATCTSAYFLLAGYAILLFTFAFGLNELRGAALFVMGAKCYAIGTYYYAEFTHPTLAPPHLGMFLAADGPYVLGIVLTLYRLLPTRPFAARADTPAPKRR